MTAVSETKAIEPVAAAPAQAGPAASAAHATRRLWEIDALRGSAVITMIIYHFTWDLVAVGVAYNTNPKAGFWYLLQRYTAITFITLAGLSATLVYQRFERQQTPHSRRFLHFVRRGLWIFMWGMVITGVLWVAGRYVAGTFNIDFGVLHLIGLSTILAYPFYRFKWLSVIAWAILFTAGGFLIGVDAPNRWLIWLGYYPQGYSALDYFPLIPWFGVFLLGVAAGNWLYPDGHAVYTLTDRSQAKPVRALRFLGRHSLPIYLTHQLVLFPLAYAIAYVVYAGLF